MDIKEFELAKITKTLISRLQKYNFALYSASSKPKVSVEEIAQRLEKILKFNISIISTGEDEWIFYNPDKILIVNTTEASTHSKDGYVYKNHIFYQKGN